MTKRKPRNNVGNTYTDEGGKFAAGNPGRPKGARHKTTLAIEALLHGQAEVLTQQAIDMALAGDMTALRLCLERIAPPRKDAPISFDLPDINTASDAAVAARAILKAVADGDVTPQEAVSIMAVVEQFRRTLETTELEGRIAKLEAGK
ncbi:MAG: hypothetical protein JKY94_11040 [Rhodobacteraceae bacterium]|nr:hypothetical protein [Paracoccaceae bacterium]